MQSRGFLSVLISIILVAATSIGIGGYVLNSKNEVVPATLEERSSESLEQKDAPQLDARENGTLDSNMISVPPEVVPSPIMTTKTDATLSPAYETLGKQTPTTLTSPTEDPPHTQSPPMQNVQRAPSSYIPQANCVSNTSPIFTSHITDMSKVDYVAPPPTMGSGPSLKTHSYIGTNHAKVPIYAPTEMTLKDGAYYVGGPYMFDFQVSCEVTVRFGHMTDPIDSIKKLLPSTPASDSRTMGLAPVHFEAGELIGYTTGTGAAGNWDYGVYNSAMKNRYENDPDWNDSSVYTTAVCPFDYFTPTLKAVYVKKFDFSILGGNPQHGESFCE